MANYESLKESGYRVVKALGNGEFLLEFIESGSQEIWFANKNHASYGIKYKNTHLEFVRSA